MRRPHRIVHRLIWLPLAGLVFLGFFLALAWRPPPDPPEAPAAETSP